MWPFRKKHRTHVTGIHASVCYDEHGSAIIDVRGQTCPGYLLAINNAVEPLPAGTAAHLLISYPPCGDDVHAWCREKAIEFEGIEPHDSGWRINIRKP